MPTIPVTGDYLVEPGDQVTIDAGTSTSYFAYALQGAATPPNIDFDDQGSIAVTSSQDGAVVGAFWDSDATVLHTTSVTLAIGSSLSVEATGAGSVAVGYMGHANVSTSVFSQGTFSVSGVSQATGAYLAGGGRFVSGWHFSVAADDAIGVFMQDDADVSNADTFTVTGQSSATGFDLHSPISGEFVNGGTITVTAASGHLGVAIALTGVHDTDHTYMIINDGSITGSTSAIALQPAANGETANVNIVNYGSIHGAIGLGLGPSSISSGIDNFITNYGSIEGDVHLSSNGVDYYRGAEGTLAGTLYLGNGTDHVTLGDDGESVTGAGTTGVAYVTGGAGDDHVTAGNGGGTISGGGGNDTLHGGDGSDTLDGGAGDDALDGGGGVDTVSYVSAGAGVTVDLSLQGAAQDTAGAGHDTLSGFENLTGSAFNDTLTGDAGDNVIDGGGGDDLVDGGGGANTVSYQSAAAGVTVSLTLEGQAQNTQGAGSDTLEHFRNLVGSIYTDVLEGDAGDNVIDGGGGGDLVLAHGMIVSDVISYASATSGVTVSMALQGVAQDTVGAGVDTLSHFDKLVGSSHDDHLSTGLHNFNFIDAGAGDDVVYVLTDRDSHGVLDGGAGVDTLSFAASTRFVIARLSDTGEQGTWSGDFTLLNFENLIGSDFGDHFEGAAGDNVIDGGAGSDTVGYGTSASGVTVSLALQGQAQDTVGAGHDALLSIENIDGSNFNDVLTGDAGDNNIEGWDGDDVIDGGAGNDVLSGRYNGFSFPTGNDTVSYASATTGVTVSLAIWGVAQDTVGAGLDTLWGFSNLTGSSFNDTLEGDYRNNVLVGGAGTNTVSYAHAAAGVTISLALQGAAQDTIGAGFDTLSNFQNLMGSAFSDVLTGDAGDNVIEGGAGYNFINGEGGSNTASYAHASAGVQVSLALQGQQQNTLGAGIDTLSNIQNLIGSAFDDILTGDPNNNVLTGGLGADTFRLGPSGGNDVISDFSHTQGDKIDLSAIYSTFAQVLSAATQSGGDTVIDLGGGSLRLQNVQLTDLSASDFMLTRLPLMVGDTVVTTDPDLNLTAATGSLIQFTSTAGGTLINKGSLVFNGSSAQAMVYTPVGPEPAAIFQNDGVFSVTAPTPFAVADATVHNNGSFTVTGTGHGFMTPVRGDVVNAGTMTIQGLDDVYGVQDWNPYGLFQNLAGGTFSVSGGAYPVFGVALANGGEIDNAGTITVSGGSAVGVALVPLVGTNRIQNTGSITVGGALGVGIQMSGYSWTMFGVVYNSGTVTAHTAIQYGSAAADITNSGVLNGDVRLTGANDRLVNTNTINGAVFMGDGDDILTSSGGTIAGVVTLGAGSSTAVLGAEDNTVALAAGRHVVDAGGGVDTVSYTGAISGVHVSLAFQGQAQATGVGTDTLSHFESIVGSAFADWLGSGSGGNVLTGGAGADTFLFATGGGSDVITDFSHDQGDRLDLSAFHGLHGLADILAVSTQAGADTVIDLGGGSEVTLRNVQKSALTAADFILGSTRLDFDDDGLSDLVWRNDSGAVSLWTAKPGQGVGFAALDLGDLFPLWQLQGGGDLNGDHRADLVWRWPTGDVGVWTASGSQGGFVGQNLGFLSLDWRFQQAADFDGDGRADVLWRNINGDVTIWASRSAGTSVAFEAHDLGPLSTSWHFQGAGDFNGDGRADLLWRNDNGDVGLWTSTGSGLAFAGQDMGYLAPGWKTQAVADFDGDGRADVLWRNDDGSVGIWTATGSTFVGHDFGYLSSSWRFQAVGDFNGDGRSDIVWRGDSGSVGVWTATAGALNFTGQDMGPVPADWRIQADWHST